MSVKLETLERLAALRDRGVLSEEEFQAEKQAIIGPAPRPGRQAAATPVTCDDAAPPSAATTASAPDHRSMSKSERGAGDVKSLWETFRPIANFDEAKMLLWAAGFLAGTVIVNGMIDVGIDMNTASSGYQIDADITNTEALIYRFVGLSIWSAVVSLAAWGVLRHRSRVAAISLIPIALMEVVASLVARWDGNPSFRLATILIGGALILLSIQAVRATYAYRKFSHLPQSI